MFIGLHGKAPFILPNYSPGGSQFMTAAVAGCFCIIKRAPSSLPVYNDVKVFKSIYFVSSLIV